MDKKKERVIEIFGEMAKIHNTLGDEFRALAFIKAIRNIKEYSGPLDLTTLKQIPGVGAKLEIKIKEILETGKLHQLEDLKKHPQLKAINRLIKLKGFSLKGIKELIQKYDVRSPNDIKRLHKQGKIKLNKNQLLGLKYSDDLETKIPREEITKIGKLIKKMLHKLSKTAKIEVVGSYRRKHYESGDIDMILVDPKNKKDLLRKLVEELKHSNLVLGTFSFGDTKFSGIIKTPYSYRARQLDILFVPYEDYHTALLHFTGSGILNRRMRLIAKDKGYKLSEKGLFKGKKKIPIKSERQVFEILNIPYLEPHERES